MQSLLVVSVAVRLAALLWALLMLRRARDLRLAFVAMTLAFAAITQAGALSFDAVRGDFVEALAGLVVSVMMLASVWLLSGFLSDKQASESTLQEREALFRSLVENSLDVIALLDDEGRVLYTNPATERVLGYEPSALLGQSAFAYLDDDDRERAVSLFLEALEHPEKGYGMLCRLRRADGSFATVQAAGSVLLSAHQDRRALLEVRDVTAEYAAASENQRLQGELYQAQKMETLGTLAGGIAHDFNNLLTPIVGNVELARRQLPPNSDVQPVLARVTRAAEQARDLVRRMLVLGRKSEGQVEPVELSTLVRETFELVHSSLPSSIRGALEVELDDLVVSADPVELQQVLLNLCTNATHAMRETGGTLRIGLRAIAAERDAREPAHRRLPEGQYALLSVEDSGVGMSAQTVARVFEPFFSTKSPGEGTGLGLSVVHGIVTGLGGVIEVQSELGRGARFEVLLPRLSNSQIPERSEKAVPVCMRGRVLLVDDQVAVVEVGAELLRMIGFEVDTAVNAALALELVCGGPDEYVAVVTDYSMPEGTGLELARELRALRADLPVVLTTGFAEADIRDQSGQLGAIVVLPKPYTIESLSEAIAEASEAVGVRAAE